jgi:predicted nucleic acid-binding Zn ribbon protein
MPTYVYETTGKTKRRFELRQSMNDAPLKHDPETGEPVIRVISGGYGIIEKGGAKSHSAPAPSGGGHCCGGGCGCGH